MTGSMAKHQEQAVISLREMILEGVLAPGAAVTEVGLCETLGISRTPIRYAMTLLEQEGLLERLPNRRYAVRNFSVDDVLGAIDVRGVLEGLAARHLAEHGLDAALRDQLHACLASGDALFRQPGFLPGDDARYTEMNRRFHQLIVEGAGNHALANALTMNDRLPFSAAGAVAFDHSGPDSQFRMLAYAHEQHHAIVRALEAGESVRAEALMREHTNASKDALNLGTHLFHARRLTLAGTAASEQSA